MAVTSPILIEPMGLADIPGVLEVERLSFSSPWPAFAFQQELTANRMARYLVARADARVIGFGGIWLMVDEAHITTFGVHPDWRRQGIGRRLLLELAELAIELDSARMTLEVRRRNAPAQALYAGFGFVEAGTRPHYYSDDGEDALIMTTPNLSDPAMQQRLAAERARARAETDR